MIKTNKKSYKHSLAGFTLIEMMVSVTIFSFVMLVAAGALITIIDGNRKAQSQQTAFSNIDFFLESFSRSVRVGSTYRCVQSNGDLNNTALDNPQDCAGGADTLAFEPFGGLIGVFGDQVVYRLNNGQVERSINGGASFVPVTSSDVVVENLDFYVRGSSPSDSEQPFVLVSMNGYVGATQKSRVNFNVQTSITQRLLDIE